MISFYKIYRTLAEDSEKFAQDIQYVDSEGNSPLHHACKLGYFPIVKLIFASEGSSKLINLQDKKQGWTPLISTIYSQDDGGPEIVCIENLSFHALIFPSFTSR